MAKPASQPIYALTSWDDNARLISETLIEMRAHMSRKPLNNNAAIQVWTEMTGNVRRRGRIVYLIGNGASASMASHISADLAKNAGIHTQVFTDMSLITATANDHGFEEVFAVPLGNRMMPGDLLVAISSSGNSPNIIAGVRCATALGCETVTLSAMRPGNQLRQLGTLSFWIPADTYGLAETCHAALLHHWVDQMVEMRA